MEEWGGWRTAHTVTFLRCGGLSPSRDKNDTESSENSPITTTCSAAPPFTSPPSLPPRHAGSALCLSAFAESASQPAPRLSYGGSRGCSVEAESGGWGVEFERVGEAMPVVVVEEGGEAGGKAVSEAEGGDGGAHGVSAVAGAVVGVDALNGDTVVLEEGDCGMEEGDRAGGGVVRERVGRRRGGCDEGGTPQLAQGGWSCWRSRLIGRPHRAPRPLRHQRSG